MLSKARSDALVTNLGFMSVSSEALHSGAALAATLTHSWRESECQEEIFPEEIENAFSLLLATGSAALIPHRVSHLPAEFVAELQEVYRRQAIAAMLQEHSVKDIFQRMRRRGVEPVLFKGWSLARLYPDAAMRPSGDIDLWLCADQLAEAYTAVPADASYCVELHTRFYRQFERSFAQVMEASQCCSLDGTMVRIPCPEDHLRFICLHFLYHGGWRPLWLCDVALMVETRSENFDWDYCLRGKRKSADWIACVIGLAHQLLGAEISGTPVEKRAKDLPGWLVSAVLKQWGAGAGMSHAQRLSLSFPRRLLKPAALLSALREHWRNPIQASVEMNAWFNNSPRGLLQLSSVFLHIPRFVRNFGQEVRRT